MKNRLRTDSKKPKHRLTIPAKMMADIERMFKDPNEANMEAFEEFKQTLVDEEMYTMLKQLYALEKFYKIYIPFKK
jgi:hypothetical protein